MRYKAHFVGGLLAGALLLNYTKQPIQSIEGVITFMAAGLGGLLPDIDHEGSYVGRRMKPLSKVISSAFGHRGATHAPILIIILFLLLHLFVNVSSMVFIGLMVGALSHVLLDALTVSGVPLLYPYQRNKYSFLKLRTGGVGETVITVLMIPLLLHLILQI